MRFDEIKQFFLDGCSVTENNRYFHPVDGIENAEQLLLAPSHEHESGIKISAAEECREEIRNNLIRTLCSGVVDYRHLVGNGSYENLLQIAPGKFLELLKTYCKMAGLEKASVIDFGCGQGNALAELTKLDFIDEKQTVGVTLPLSYMDGKAPHVTKFRNPNIMLANALHLRPKTEFDIAISVFGIRSYHPYDREFGLLQMIAALKKGGLLLTAPDYESYYMIPELVDKKILVQPDEFRDFVIPNADLHCVFVLDQKPSHEKLCKLAIRYSELITDIS